MSINVIRAVMAAVTARPATLLVVAVSYAAIVGHFPIARIVDRLWSDMTKGQSDHFAIGPRPSAWHAALVGILERGFYVIALNASHPEFMGFWIGVKTATGWNGWKDGYEEERNGKMVVTVSGRELANTFLIGNGLSAAFAFGTWRALVAFRAGDQIYGLALAVGVVLAAYFVNWSIPRLIRSTEKARRRRNVARSGRY